MATEFTCVAMWHATLVSNQKYSGACNYTLFDNGNLDMLSLLTGSCPPGASSHWSFHELCTKWVPHITQLNFLDLSYEVTAEFYLHLPSFNRSLLTMLLFKSTGTSRSDSSDFCIILIFRVITLK